MTGKKYKPARRKKEKEKNRRVPISQYRNKDIGTKYIYE